jgi:hypothetical protein
MIDYRIQEDEITEDEIMERISINVTPKMKKLLTFEVYQNQLIDWSLSDDDILELTSKYRSELRDEVLLNLHF